MQTLIGLLLALATTTPSVAVTPSNVAVTAPAAQKVPVFLHFDAEDAVGSAYVSRLREAIETSTMYKSVTKATDAQFVIGIVTMDPNEAHLGSGSGRSTVAAVTLQLENEKGLNYMVYSWVLIANQEKVDSLATDLFVAIDKEIQELQPSRTATAAR